MKTPPVIFKHLNRTDLPVEWAKYLPAEQTFTVLVLAERSESPWLLGKELDYLQYLRTSGINVERLQESIQQLEMGQVDTVAWDELDDFLGNS
jgi:hypothetical protein